MNLIKRLFDISISIFLILILIWLFFLLAILVKISSKGPVIHWSSRIGMNNRLFEMPKLRSMKIDSPNVATHLLKDTDSHLTPIGSFLRKTSLDELPQLFSILKGDMSLVGPRPALFNQYDLILMREEKNINTLVPGITGWAQVNGRDELTISDKVDFDYEYLKKKSFWFDLKVLWMTLLKVIWRDGISH